MLAQNINNVRQVKLLYNCGENKDECFDFFNDVDVYYHPNDGYKLRVIRLLSSFPVEHLIVTIFEEQDTMLPTIAQMREVKTIFASLKITIVHYGDPDTTFVSVE